ncbi:hypothetical protein M7775_07940 [Sporomusa sphaeroides DSM 2875]|uniref:hypothetical protein n=1 Tax=Sporomusa sphaeroides TaxID=47679 RepID=UPI00202F461C|nr:hypothetical protein [Sporomusa sphaeroides]MCM0758500.1 hypothetical protein [Sporomusa sphaeroides DSM 2875]
MWFLAKDVAEWIEHNKPSEMLSNVDECEKLKAIISHSGQAREMWCLTEDVDWFMLSENLQREDLSEVEKAEKLHEMMIGNQSLSTRKAAEKLGLNQGYIVKLLQLHGYPTEVKEEIKAGAVAADTIRSINKLETPEEQTKVVSYVIDNELNRKQVDETIEIIKALPVSIREKLTEEPEYTIVNAKEEFVETYVEALTRQ